MLAVYIISVLPAPFSPTRSISAIISILERRCPTEAFCLPGAPDTALPSSPIFIQDYCTVRKGICQQTFFVLDFYKICSALCYNGNNYLYCIWNQIKIRVDRQYLSTDVAWSS